MLHSYETNMRPVVTIYFKGIPTVYSHFTSDEQRSYAEKYVEENIETILPCLTRNEIYTHTLEGKGENGKDLHFYVLPDSYEYIYHEDSEHVFQVTLRLIKEES